MWYIGVLKVFCIYQLLQLIAYMLRWATLLFLGGRPVGETHAGNSGRELCVMVQIYRECTVSLLLNSLD